MSPTSTVAQESKVLDSKNAQEKTFTDGLG